MGAVAGRYEVVRTLGRGGMGEVVLARQRNLGRLVVLKRVLPEHSQREVRALLDEARLAAQLHHGNLVTILDVGDDTEDPFIAMEYVPGVTLRELLEHAPDGLPADVALAIASDVLRGLVYAHGVRRGGNVGVVHRDVKPRNIMVAFAGTAKLIDFGISRWLAQDGGWEATSVSGTHGYMAPEQRKGGRVDGRADLYAVGVTLREMLLGPPRGDDAERAPAEPREIPEPLAAILDRACAEQPADRFDDGDAMIAALGAYATVADLAPSTASVARWGGDHLADRIAAFEVEAERARSPHVTAPTMRAIDLRGELAAPRQRTPERPRPLERPPEGPPERPPERTAATRSERVAPGEQPPAVSREHSASVSGEQLAVAPADSAAGAAMRLRRKWPWLAGAAAAVVGAAVAALHLSAPPEQSIPRVLVVATAGDASDAWLATATQHLATRVLRDAAHRGYWLAARPDDATTRLELAVRRAGDGLHVDASRDGEPLGHADARSIADALDQLGDLPAALGDADTALPDDAERAEMTRIGARDASEYRAFRAAYEGARRAGAIDSSTFAARQEALLALDPAWAHPYAELFWMYGSSTAKAKRIADTARATADRARDPVGMTLVEALAGTPEQAVRLSEPVFRAAPQDLLAGEVLSSALADLHRRDEVLAVYRHLAEVEPELEYTSDFAGFLDEDGRTDEAERALRDSIEAYPDNLASTRELITLQSRRADLAAAKQLAARMLLVHGERMDTVDELYEAMVASDDLFEAQRLADKMLLGTALGRARGRYRGAAIAVLEGRFSAAYHLGEQAYDELGSYGKEGELWQCLVLLHSIAPLVAPADTARWASKLVDAFTDSGDASLAAVYRYRADVAGCPDIDRALGALAGDDRTAARRAMLRFGAARGCVPCKDAVAEGLGTTEEDPAALVALGHCARAGGELDLARRSLGLASRLWSSWLGRQASPYDAVMARFELAGVLADLHDASASAQYQRALRAWGHADHALPIVDQAKAAVGLLPSP